MAGTEIWESPWTEGRHRPQTWKEVHGLNVVVLDIDDYTKLVEDSKKLWEPMSGDSAVQCPNHPNNSTVKMEKYHVIYPGRGVVYAKDEINYLMEESKCFSGGHLALITRLKLAEKLICAEAFCE
jgi:hypothetical protein